MSTTFETVVAAKYRDQSEKLAAVARNIAGRPAVDLIDVKTQERIRAGQLRARMQDSLFDRGGTDAAAGSA